MELKNVTLEKTDTCLTYALKRIGLPTDITFEDIHDHFELIRYRTGTKKLEVGDLFLWDKNIEWEWLPWSINSGGIKWKSVPVKFHFGVYEGDGSFTDCTRLVTPPHPSLRFRNLLDLRKNPDWILKSTNVSIDI